MPARDCDRLLLNKPHSAIQSHPYGASMNFSFLKAIRRTISAESFWKHYKFNSTQKNALSTKNVFRNLEIFNNF